MLEDLFPCLNYSKYVKVLGCKIVDNILDDLIEKEFDIKNPDPKFCYNVLDAKLAGLSKKKNKEGISCTTSKKIQTDTKHFFSTKSSDKSSTLSKKAKKEQEIKNLVTTTTNHNLSKLKNVDLTEKLKDNNDNKMKDATKCEKNSKITIGMHVKKYFEGHGYFHGKIQSYGKEYYQIVYDDGDEEELTEDEVLEIICNDDDDHDVVKKRKGVSKKNTKRITKKKFCEDSDEENEFCFDDNEKQTKFARRLISESDDEEN